MTPRGCSAGRCCLLGAMILVAAVALLAFNNTMAVAAEEIYVDFGSSMVYLPNPSDPGIGMTWTAEVFPGESGWTPGSYGVGFETSTGAENLLLTNVTPTTGTSAAR